MDQEIPQFVICLKDRQQIYSGDARSVAKRLVSFEIASELKKIDATHILMPVAEIEERVQEVEAWLKNTFPNE